MEIACYPAVEEVFDLYKTYGRLNRAGEPVSPLEHMSQTAQCAIAAGADNEVVLAAFFHDIGFLVTRQHGFVGRRSFEWIGSEFLRRCGFSERLTRLVGGHVQGKRYLSFSCCHYFARLNELARHELACEGGPMSRGEARAFEQDPFFNHYVSLRRWDQQARARHAPVMDLAELRWRMEAALQG